MAYRAEVLAAEDESYWKSSAADNANCHLCGKILAFNAIRNPLTGNDLYWIRLDLNNFELEVLVNQHALIGSKLQIGASLKAEVWLQGHAAGQSAFRSNYEGVDWSQRTIDFWKKFKRQN